MVTRLDEERARQGHTGTGLRWMLWLGLAAAALALYAALLLHA